MPPPRPLVLPRFTEPESSGRVPILASLVPLLIALVAWGLTRSPYLLLFALASPLAAGGAVLDRRSRRRKERRRMLTRTRVRLDRLRDDIAVAHRLELERLELLAPHPGRIGQGGRADSGVLRWGTARVDSGIVLDGADEEPPPELRAEVTGLVERAATLRGPVVTRAAREIAILGPPVLTRAAARWLAIQLLALARSPVGPGAGEVPLPAAELVDNDDSFLIIGADPAGSARIRCLPEAAPDPAAEAVLRIGGASAAVLEIDGRLVGTDQFEVGLLGTQSARAALERMREITGIREQVESPPDAVSFAELAELPHRDGGLIAPIGRAAVAPVWVDLVRDGPHAVVGGTTGSGKSELLVGWVLALAQRYDPGRLGFLLIDFKGASAFAPLRALPHVVGIVSDLDQGVARRAALSLRSELVRRERLLAEAEAREVEELHDVGRLVVVIDEYAALVAEHPDLHDLVGDLAARGRSLGIHLILCTQRPSGVMRDEVLANAVLRVSLRVNNRADSIALIASDAAAAIPPQPPGRGLLRCAGADPIPVQFARATERDITEVVSRHRTAIAPIRPWAEPLPRRVAIADLVAPREGVPFGLVDLPEQQRVASAAYSPERDGNLLIVGGRGAGTTTAIAALGRGLGTRAVAIPPHGPDAWAALQTVLDAERPEGTVVLVDDLDRLLDGVDEEVRPGLVRMLSGLARELAVRGGALVMGASRMPTAASALTSLIDSRLILRLPDRDAHLLAGGSAADWSPRRPPGRGLWHDREVQVAIGAPPLLPVRVRVPVIDLHPGTPTAVASGQVERLSSRLSARGVSVLPVAALVLGSPPETATGDAERLGTPGAHRSVVVLGDPDEWTDSWAALESARRSLPFLVHAAAPSDLRALGRIRVDPPPLDPRATEAWLLRGRRVERVSVPWTGAMAP